MSSTSRTLKLLDCFSALGGVSEGFLAEGYEVHGIELNAEVAQMYYERLNAKYPGKVTVEVADISKLNGSMILCCLMLKFATFEGVLNSTVSRLSLRLWFVSLDH